MRVLPTLCLAFAALISCAASANDDWRLEKDEDGIQIYTRAVEGKTIREIRGEVKVPARLTSVVAVLSDVAANKLLSDVVAESSVPQRDSDTRYQVYSVLKMPWPVSNRDMLNQREISQDPQSLVVTINNIALPNGLPAKDGLIRIVDSRQLWRVSPTADGKVSVEMQAFTDPAGSIPTSVINSMSVGAPFKSMVALRDLAQQPKYKNATLAFVKEP